MFLLFPIQQLWENSFHHEDGVEAMKNPEWLAGQSENVPIRRMFAHGPGGSGKTYFLTEVVLPVARHFFGENGTKAIAAHNSAARLLHGSTMHSAGKMTRGQSMTAKKLRPMGNVKTALEKEWSHTACLVVDELGLAAPRLVAAVSRRAFHARATDRGWDNREIELAEKHPFGDVPIQAIAADMMQLNPVMSHSMVEAYCEDFSVPGVPIHQTAEDEEAYGILKKGFKDVVLFTGSHRFIDKDLPALLSIMAKPGGARVPEVLRGKIIDRIQKDPSDPRIQTDFKINDQKDSKAGFFAFGVHAAIQWDQVMRATQLHILQAARLSHGPDAFCNNDDGTPRFVEDQGSRQCRGQLVYCFQAVDSFRHTILPIKYRQALEFMNLSKTKGLHGILLVYMGMRIRLTKKICAPDLVQEAVGTIVGIRFHTCEQFGHTASTRLGPAPTHPCWQIGWVQCTYLPLHIEIRFDDCSTDYTGLGRPGVWFLQPKKDDWELPIKVTTTTTINHPNTQGPVMKDKHNTTLNVTRYQVPLTHENVKTFQNIQGSTVKHSDGSAKGLVVDLERPSNMGESEYFQHIYMVLGRARSLEHILLRNFPHDNDGMKNWSIFESGPPGYLVEFMKNLKIQAKKTWPRLIHAQQKSGMPKFEDLPVCDPDPESEGRFIYKERRT